ncbi:glyceraldehyde-3-phosphate dehydrogenase [Shewanella maritima]|uniref:glyceraldehyde-3-phosphate dehydrogenase n=1 Tax=Shewanella maritima TaxID=2520507 RepID=UPI001F5E7346|nr:glyceraldehyde-3-phosphate dehydrogenase [Shewanella maritima]
MNTQNQRNKFVPLKTITAAIALLGCVSHSQADFMEQFRDSKDGKFDVSQWILDNAVGFMPVPLIVTEPAVGAGGGAALLFFHETDEQKAIRQQNPDDVSGIPPSVTGVVGLATSNGSKLAGVFHSGNWKEDNIRYLGGFFGASFNLKQYENGSDKPNEFNMQGHYFFQDIDFRIAGSNFFVGADYVNMSSTTLFKLADPIEGVPSPEFDSVDAHVGVKLTYDSLDNTFSARSGTKAGIKAKFHGKKVGGDFDYQDYHLFVNNYTRLSPKWGLGVRLDGKSATEGVPFYAKPFIDMRGMAAMRYQADNTALGEIELSYDIDDRWTVLGFAGTGKAFDHNQSFSDAKWQSAQGGGFRYLIARQLGIRAGIDIAKGPEEWTTYIQFGGAW